MRGENEKNISYNLFGFFFVFILKNSFYRCYFSYQVAAQLTSRGWVDPIPEPILAEKILENSQKSNPGHLGSRSDY